MWMKSLNGLHSPSVTFLWLQNLCVFFICHKMKISKWNHNTDVEAYKATKPKNSILFFSTHSFFLFSPFSICMHQIGLNGNKTILKLLLCILPNGIGSYLPLQCESVVISPVRWKASYFILDAFPLHTLSMLQPRFGSSLNVGEVVRVGERKGKQAKEDERHITTSRAHRCNCEWV